MNAEIILRDDDGTIVARQVFGAVERSPYMGWRNGQYNLIIRNGVLIKGFRIEFETEELHAKNLEERPIPAGERSGTEHL